ncbi:MAG: hypothetical protein WCF84_26525 [Anaerolineae bacterium]
MRLDLLQQLVDELLRAWSRGDPRLLVALLLLGSFLLYAIAANLAWYYRGLPAGQLAERVNRLVSSRPTRIGYELVRLVYYVVTPFAALMLGWVNLRALGLAYLDWADGLRWEIVLTLATWSLLMFVWVPYLKTTSDVPPKLSSEVTSWARRIVEIVYMQAHWAFYRAACILILTNLLQDDIAIYWGACIGIGLVAVEAWSDPRVRRHVANIGESEVTLWSASQAIINTVGFVFTRNIWLMALLHLMLEFSVPHLRTAPRPAIARPAPHGTLAPTRDPRA